MFYLISLSATTLLIVYLFIFISKNNSKSQINKCFSSTLICLLIWCVGLILQILFSEKYNINPILFDYFVYLGTCFLPVTFFFTSLSFAKTKLTFKWKYIFTFIVPIISLLILWTNNMHHLFFIEYSVNISEGKTGQYFIIHSLYTYILFAISFYILLKHSIKNVGVFSKQAVLIILGGIVPLVTNLLGVLHIINMSIYITPITFVFTVTLCALAIFKFGFLKITPVALQMIVDRITDSYVVLNEDLMIVSFNKTFTNTFNVHKKLMSGMKFEDFKELKIIYTKVVNKIEETRTNSAIVTLDEYFKNINKYFHIEVSSIIDRDNFLGTLILFKDTTQHILDLQTIENNQNMLIERERLASLGQLIGGIAHNLKTPIMSISGAAEGLTDLIKEYETSVGDPEVTVEDHHDIAKDMKDWIEKIRSYTEYMSDIITAVKGQAVTMSEEQAISFTLDELVKRVNILMRHELKNALVNLDISMQVDESTSLKGNINSLVQVVNNMISNAIQAYDGKPNQKIDLILSKENDNIVITVKDYGCGLPDEVQKKLFKEMITTKGKNGTGLGLFMSYSNIRAHFNGNVTFETEKNKGTTFNILLPIN